MGSIFELENYRLPGIFRKRVSDIESFNAWLKKEVNSSIEKYILRPNDN